MSRIMAQRLLINTPTHWKTLLSDIRQLRWRNTQYWLAAIVKNKCLEKVNEGRRQSRGYIHSFGA